MSKALLVKGLDENGQRISSKDYEELVQQAFAKSKNLKLETYNLLIKFFYFSLIVVLQIFM